MARQSATTFDGVITLPSLTTTARDALTPVTGMVIYNSTTAQFEVYLAGAWHGLVSDLGATLTGPLAFSGTTNAGIKVNNLTTTQRDALTPTLGMIIFNTTTTSFQIYTAGGTWHDLVSTAPTIFQPLKATVFDGTVSFTGTTNPGLAVSSLTTTQRDALATPANGTIIYNSTTDTFQIRAAGTWAHLLPDPGSNGLVARTATGASAARTITAGSSKVVVTNGNGVSANPAIDLATGIVAATRVTFSNAAATIAATTTYEAQVGTMSASRVLTLPAANAVPAGHPIVIADESGTVTNTNTIVITCAGADTFFATGQTTETIRNPGGFRTLVSDGTSKWIVVSKTPQIPSDLWQPGLLAATVPDLTVPSGTRAVAAATQWFFRVPLPRPLTIASVVYEVSALASGNTHGYVSWYDSAGTMQAQSSDLSTTWQTTGLKTTALAYTPVWSGPDTFGWLCFYTGTGTLLSFRAASGGSGLGNVGQAASALRGGTIALADTATMPSITPSNIVSGNGIIVAALI